MPDIVDWQQPPRRHRRLFFLVLGFLAIVIFSSRTALSYYVDALVMEAANSAEYLTTANMRLLQSSFLFCLLAVHGKPDCGCRV
jgi:hypothetical protein